MYVIYIHITHPIRRAYVYVFFLLTYYFRALRSNRFAHVRNYVHGNRMEIPEWKMKNRMEV